MDVNNQDKMMEPISIMTSLIASGAGSAILDVGVEIVKNLLERSSEAERVYEYNVATLEDELRNKRQTLLEKLNELQTRAMLGVSDQTFLLQITTNILQLRISTHEATTEYRLDLVSDKLSQIESSLDRYDLDKQFRNRVRKTAVVISVIAFIILFTGAIVSPRFGLDENYAVPVLQIPLSVLMWSAIGSFTSLLYRFNRSSDAELQDPLRWLITRPITGIMMGTIVYLAVSIGFIAALPSGQSAVGNNFTNQANELIWLISFLVGFSDRFSESILSSLVGQFSGDKNPDLLIPDRSVSRLNFVELLESWGIKQPISTTGDDTVAQKADIDGATGEIQRPDSLLNSSPIDLKSSTDTSSEKPHYEDTATNVSDGLAEMESSNTQIANQSNSKPDSPAKNYGESAPTNDV